jgi:hypothetical protein
MTNLVVHIVTIDVCAISDYEDCHMRGYDRFWPGKNLLTCRRKVEGKGKAIPLNPWTGL